MGLAQKKTIEFGSETSKRRMRPRAARAFDPAHHSPAAALQERLERSLSEAPVEEGRWSARRTRAFMTITSGAFWIGLGLLISRL
jgi:hypothetical protein